MSSKIFIIEDIAEMSDLISMYIKNADMDPVVCYSAEDALEALKETPADAILLDLNLPKMSGFEFLKKFRASYKATIPVIIVSARDSDEDIICALDSGADEFVTKPFSPRVLVARLQANMRRLAQTEAAVEKTLTFGEYTILENSCVLKKGPEKIPLSAKEFEVLSYLAHNAGQNLSPDTIFNDVWKVKYGDVTAVAVYIQRLRKKIEANPADPKYIKTIYKYGYRFELGDSGK